MKSAPVPGQKAVDILKEKILTIGSYVLVALAAAGLTLGLVNISLSASSNKLSQLEALILERFIGETDAETLEDAAADAMVDATGDRWSYYMTASSFESYQEQMANAYVGVGITIEQQSENQGFLIVAVTAGGPAEEAGLQINDLLIAVDGTDVREMTTTEVRSLVRGEEGTTVSMTVLRTGDSVTISVERRQVQTPVATYEMLEDNVGLVTIENFASRCAEEPIAASETRSDNGAAKLRCDVRYHPGGYADELVQVLDYLLPEGEIFHTVTYDGTEDIDYSDAACVDLPMAVLVNASSYSAAEFFAAALSEYEAAIVVGEPTVGKGYFQNTFVFSDGSAVALSVGEYYTPSGKNLAGVGVTPDIEVPVDEETDAAIYYGTLTPAEDPQIQAAVEALADQK